MQLDDIDESFKMGLLVFQFLLCIGCLRFNRITKLLLPIFFFLMGCMQVALLQNYRKGIPEKKPNDSFYAIGTQTGYAQKTTLGWNVVMRFNAYLENQRFVPIEEKWMISVVGDSINGNLFQPGRRFFIKLQVKEPMGAKFPDGFSWKDHLMKSGINRSGKSHLNNIHLMSESNFFWKAAHQTRNHFSKLLSEQITDTISLGVAGALLLGNEEWLSGETELSFANAGVLHVLCVSGMHVVLVYSLLIRILSPFIKKKSRLRNLIFPLLIMIVWMYAIVSGFGSSVIRAAAMATFMLMANWVDRKVNVWNLMCASLILILLFDPFLIRQIGFQLSFLAVCGILLISPFIQNIAIPANRFIKWIMELAAVTISAQIATFPISLYLFGQFPNWFLLANMVVVPLSTLVMYIGLGMMAFCWIPFFGKFISIVFEFSVWLLRESVNLFGSFPYAVSSNVHFTSIMCFSTYMLILALVIVNLKGNFRNWALLLFTSNLLILTFIMSSIQVKNRDETFLTIIDKSFVIVTTENGKSEITILARGTPQKTSSLGSQIATRLGTRTSISCLTEDSDLIHVSKHDLMVINRWGRRQLIDQHSNKIAEKVKILVIGDSTFGFSEKTLDDFPNLKTIILKNHRIQEKIQAMVHKRRLPLKLINLTNSGHYVLVSN